MEIPVVFLGQKGEIRQGKLKGTTPAAFTTALKKKEPPSLLGKIPWKQKTLFMFGYLEGKDSTENQHHLPAPLEGITFYGDILVAASNNPNSYTTLVPLKTAEYETFYTSKLEGDDEEVLSESEEEEEAEVAEEEEEEDIDVGYGDAEEEAVNEDESLSEDEAAPVVRATRVRRVQAVAVEEAEINEEEPAEKIPVRKNVCDIIASKFGECDGLEQAIFKASVQLADKEQIRKAWGSRAFRDVYLSIARRMIGNMDPNSYIGNKNLWERFENKELTLEQIANQNYFELCPENWQSLIDRQVKRERVQLEGDFSRATEKFTCNSCKQRKCTYYELQTRSADEPMTLFIHCLNCQKRWTQ
jgi:DNA-directed RNA polymerase subunit M/transcription elongation factor TFIIS